MVGERSAAWRAVLLAVLSGLALWSCAPAAPPVEARNEGPPLPESVLRLERVRDAYGRNPEVRDALAREYYRVARSALDARDEARYREFLAQAQSELIAAIRLEPENPDPHNQMGIILAYQGNLDGAHQSFANGLRLLHRRIPRGAAIDGNFYSNLAHIDVYRGNFDEARRYLEIGRRRRAAPDEIDRIETLLAWRTGGRLDGSKRFAAALSTPGFADTWDNAPLPVKMATFDDFCAVCCANPSCGPHMEGACLSEGQAVRGREVTRETLVEEMRLERERRAKLKEIYERERSLSIEVEPGAKTTPPPAPEPAP